MAERNYPVKVASRPHAEKGFVIWALVVNGKEAVTCICREDEGPEVALRTLVGR